MSTTTLTQPLKKSSKLSGTTIIRRMIPGLLEGSIPFIVYTLTKSTFHTSDIVALSIGAIIPAILGLVRFFRARSFDIVNTLILVGIISSIIAALIGGNPQLLLIREAFVGALIGLVFLASLLAPRPMFFYLMRQFRAGRDAEQVAAINAQWLDSARLRNKCRIITAVWGISLLAEFSLRVLMIYTLPVAATLAISSVTMPIMTISITAWMIWYMRRQ